MITKTITYTDFDGEQRTEDFRFNLTKGEVLDRQTSVDGGYIEMLQRIVAEKNPRRLIEEFKSLIHDSYGVKSPDGKKFMKSKELLDDFKATEAYSELYVELATNSEKAAEFIKGIMPQESIPSQQQVKQAQNPPMQLITPES